VAQPQVLYLHNFAVWRRFAACPRCSGPARSMAARSGVNSIGC
jgi:hypothetical protein